MRFFTNLTVIYRIRLETFYFVLTNNEKTKTNNALSPQSILFNFPTLSVALQAHFVHTEEVSENFM